jgi:hypothetical protein
MLPLAILRRHLGGTLLLASTVTILGLAILAARSWLAAHDAAVHLAATLEAQERVLAQATERQRQRDAELAAALAGIEQAKRRVNTPARAAAEIPQLLPPLPAYTGNT